jgi:hypothetical protein
MRGKRNAATETFALINSQPFYSANRATTLQLISRLISKEDEKRQREREREREREGRGGREGRENRR